MQPDRVLRVVYRAQRLSEERDEVGSRLVYKGHTFGVYCIQVILVRWGGCVRDWEGWCQEYQGSLYTGSLDETVSQSHSRCTHTAAALTQRLHSHTTYISAADSRCSGSSIQH